MRNRAYCAAAMDEVRGTLDDSRSWVWHSLTLQKIAMKKGQTQHSLQRTLSYSVTSQSMYITVARTAVTKFTVQLMSQKLHCGFLKIDDLRSWGCFVISNPMITTRRDTCIRDKTLITSNNCAQLRWQKSHFAHHYSLGLHSITSYVKTVTIRDKTEAEAGAVVETRDYQTASRSAVLLLGGRRQRTRYCESRSARGSFASGRALQGRHPPLTSHNQYQIINAKYLHTLGILW